MITIDGSSGEGGGQILRTSLALSLVTGQSFRITQVRAGRKKPGLLRQHLTAVRAATEIADAKVTGAEPGSMELVFRPGKVQPGSYEFAVGTAGSATLVLQTVLPALLLATHPSTLVIEGGTHNPHAPPFDFLAKTFLPLLERMGPKVRATLERPGFYPAGGGRLFVTIEPVAKLAPLELETRGEIKRRQARALVANLNRNVAARELAVFAEQLGWTPEHLHVEEVKNSCGPGNVLIAELESDQLTEVFSGFGERGVSAETVAANLVTMLREYLASDAAAGCHLADQLLLPMALAGGGSFTTTAPSRHTTTNIETIKHFCGGSFQVEKESMHWVVHYQQ